MRLLIRQIWKKISFYSFSNIRPRCRKGFMQYWKSDASVGSHNQCDQMEELKVAQFIPKDAQKVAKTNFSDILQNSS